MVDSMQPGDARPHMWLPLSSAPTQSARSDNIYSYQKASNSHPEMNEQQLTVPSYAAGYLHNIVPDQYNFGYQRPWSAGNRRSDMVNAFPKDDLACTATHETVTDMSGSRDALSVLSYTDHQDRATSATSFGNDVDAASSMYSLDQSFETILPEKLSSTEYEPPSQLNDLGEEHNRSNIVAFRYSVREGTPQVRDVLGGDGLSEDSSQ